MFSCSRSGLLTCINDYGRNVSALDHHCSGFWAGKKFPLFFADLGAAGAAFQCTSLWQMCFFNRSQLSAELIEGSGPRGCDLERPPQRGRKKKRASFRGSYSGLAVAAAGKKKTPWLLGAREHLFLCCQYRWFDDPFGLQYLTHLKSSYPGFCLNEQFCDKLRRKDGVAKTSSFRD